MKFSELWLREWVDPPIDTKTLANQLTMAGLEVGSIEPIAGAFKGVVVGFVLAREQHPNADRLSVCQVDIGSHEVLTIVCGAANVRANLKVAVAVVGAVLPGDFTIKTAKLRGVTSHGMICSAQELGLTENAEGILELEDDAPVGMDFRAYMKLDDNAITVELTPNRGDCLSLYGMAREVAAINAMPPPQIHLYVAPVDTAAFPKKAVFPIQVLAPEDCPQYVGRIIADMDMNAKTPTWIKERLRRSGLRSIHLVVDVTNYVLLELGQPLHAFDLDKLNGSIVVRRAVSGELLTLLDNRTITLSTDTLVIADEETPLALAGIMGGSDSAITDNTRHVFLESAFFNPSVIAGRARRYGLSTDASHRFERFVSPDLQVVAIERATQLLLEIAGGMAGPLNIVRHEAFIPKPITILLRRDQVSRLLGIVLEDMEIRAMLERLSMTLTAVERGWEVEVPLSRFDIQSETDLIEEVARIYGYEKIEAVISPVSAALLTKNVNPKTLLWDYRLEMEQFLMHRGYQEAITYSFIDPKMHAYICPLEPPLVLENPLSPGLSTMRASLWPGLLQAVVDNRCHQQLRVRLFETGLCFRRNVASSLQSPLLVGDVYQIPTLAAVVTATRYPEQWCSSRDLLDFFDLKGDLEALLNSVSPKNAIQFLPGEHVALHPGQTAEIFLNHQSIGYIGALHPKLLQAFELEAPVYLFEITLNVASKPYRHYQMLSKFPCVRRDIAIVVNREVLAVDLLNTIKDIGGEHLKETWVFDVYQGKGIDPKQKSLAMGLIWQHADRTLLDEEITRYMQQVVAALRTRFGAILRE